METHNQITSTPAPAPAPAFIPAPIKKREASVGVAAGMMGIGKTVETLKQLKLYVQGNPAKGIKPRSVIILDVNNEYSNVKTLHLKDVARFGAHPVKEIRRIQPFKENGTAMELEDVAEALYYILKNFKGGAILLEDINRYVSDSLPQNIVGAICTVRHRATDIVIHLQSIGRILPKLWQNLSWVRYHKHLESVEKNKNKLEERYEIFKIAEYIVNKKYDEGDIRFSLTIHFIKNKIIGNYTKQDLLYAIEEYLSMNYNAVVKPLADKVNMEGKKINTPKSAMQYLRKKLYLLYYGN